jgi:hypothetical protein
MPMVGTHFEVCIPLVWLSGSSKVMGETFDQIVSH